MATRKDIEPKGKKTKQKPQISISGMATGSKKRVDYGFGGRVEVPITNRFSGYVEGGGGGNNKKRGVDVNYGVKATFNLTKKPNSKKTYGN
jgi:hypothetical protein